MDSIDNTIGFNTQPTDLPKPVLHSQTPSAEHPNLYSQANMQKIRDERMEWINNCMANVNRVMEERLVLMGITYDDIVNDPNKYKMLKEVGRYAEEYHERYSVNGVRLVHVVWTPVSCTIYDTDLDGSHIEPSSPNDRDILPPSI